MNPGSCQVAEKPLSATDLRECLLIRSRKQFPPNSLDIASTAMGTPVNPLTVRLNMMLGYTHFI